jgi:FkbM family methyltransferase
MHPEVIHLRRLPFGALCVEGDCNMPPRATALGHLDIDGQMPAVARAAGVREGDTVIDVGAFVGDTAYALSQAGASYVIAFEPFYDAYVCAAFNTRKLNVEVINSPTGNGETVRMVYECPGPNFGMRMVLPDNGPDAIPTFRIDSLKLPSCKLMKIDCEGAEIETLRGARETILRCRPFLFVEAYRDALAKRGYTAEDLENELLGLGYSLEMWGGEPRWDWFCKPILSV